MIDTPSSDARRLRAALVELIGEEPCEGALRWLSSPPPPVPANPVIFSPLDSTPYPPGVSILVLISTDQPSLHYDVLLYDHPDTTNEIFGYYYVQGAPIFGAEIPYWVLQPGHTYRIKVQVNPNPENHNTSYIDIPILATIPTYYREDWDGDVVVKKAGRRAASRRPTKHPSKNGEKTLQKAGGKSGK